MNSGVDCLLESNESLRGASAALSDLIEEAPCIAHLKDAQTGKYIYSNDHWIEKLGLKSAKDIYGLTVDDLTGTDGVYTKWNFGHSFLYYREELSKEIHRLESQAQIQKHCVSSRRIYFTFEGSLIISDLIKRPVLGRDNWKIVAILTYSQDRTPQQNLSSLLQLYLEYYPEQQALQHLLLYLDIEGYFIELPTLKEVQMLFAMSPDFDFSGVDNPDIQKLQDKVETASWHELVTRLRARPSAFFSEIATGASR
ncbi:Putative transcriptional regulator [Candidatus Glomeribacter gigasporarum BEG34]|uniref:Putative transcriptional regulator n=1 Tax=Candidatus Glomeribacter gigasporarum BEG34 TaxID=1070319 RepID=G2J8W7_9BURK|nr:hypothetical protein [Candidatus Glomeribacter gigasporarum]CCD29214.1 Putative transcriptional regulator [Candidatus Glomeribacter gigasporarum BEG34]